MVMAGAWAWLKVALLEDRPLERFIGVDQQHLERVRAVAALQRMDGVVPRVQARRVEDDGVRVVPNDRALTPKEGADGR